MDPQFDKNLIWTGIIYFIGLYLLQVAWWKALIVAVAMMISWYLTYGRRITVSVGLIIFLLGLSSWSGLLPTSSDLGHFLATLRPEVR